MLGDCLDGLRDEPTPVKRLAGGNEVVDARRSPAEFIKWQTEHFRMRVEQALGPLQELDAMLDEGEFSVDDLDPFYDPLFEEMDTLMSLWPMFRYLRDNLRSPSRELRDTWDWIDSHLDQTSDSEDGTSDSEDVTMDE